MKINLDRVSFPIISKEDNTKLIAQFTSEEIHGQ